jgi:hypothetical protein
MDNKNLLLPDPHCKPLIACLLFSYTDGTASVRIVRVGVNAELFATLMTEIVMTALKMDGKILIPVRRMTITKTLVWMSTVRVQ